MDAASEPPTGPFAVANADRGLAAEVPGDALYYSEAGNLGAALGGGRSSRSSRPLRATPEGAEQLQTDGGGARRRSRGAGELDRRRSGRHRVRRQPAVRRARPRAERRRGGAAAPRPARRRSPPSERWIRTSGISVEETEVAGVTVTTIPGRPRTRASRCSRCRWPAGSCSSTRSPTTAPSSASATSSSAACSSSTRPIPWRRGPLRRCHRGHGWRGEHRRHVARPRRNARRAGDGAGAD